MVRLTEAELDAWWGYDLTAPGGLLDRIYRELQVGRLAGSCAHRCVCSCVGDEAGGDMWVHHRPQSLGRGGWCWCSCAGVPPLVRG
jgi:hypothetical protein